MTRIYLLPLAVLFLFACNRETGKKSLPPRGSKGYIGVSQADHRYFSYSDGTPYIPVGINMINPSFRNHGNPDSAFIEIEGWMKNLSENGGNYVRIWLSESFWDMEDQKAGEYNADRINRIDRFFSLARKYGLRVKVTMEHFRSVTLAENNQSWAAKFVYHTSKGGPLDSIRQYITTPAGHKLFLDKADFYRKHFGNDTLIFGWELWNEMNAMHGPQDSLFFEWNRKMLGEVKGRFPENLVMQSFGSFDNDDVRPSYKEMIMLGNNQVAQVHRYLDPGAPLGVCQAPMDVISSSAVEEILSYGSNKPVLLAETGAVEARHSGPSKLYPADTAGILLHDILFAPFFSGAAGTGMCWHWESYVDRNNLWYHFGRFSEAVKGINPLEEHFTPGKTETDILRIYILKGKNTTLLWLRDKANNWQSELVDGTGPLLRSGIVLGEKIAAGLDNPGAVKVYDPWKNTWSEPEKTGSGILLPEFRRSLVIRIINK
jgi:hypothetical protein